MVTLRDVDIVRDRIIEAFKPRVIYLFGSLVEGTSGQGNDVDLLVVAESDEPWGKRYTRAQFALLGTGVPADVFVYTPEEFQRVSADRTRMEYRIARTGQVLYRAGA